MSFKVKIYGETDVGRQRDHNEDSFGIFSNDDKGWSEVVSLEKDISNSKGIIAVVADGMGGANAGEVASDIAVKTVKEELKTITTIFSDVSEFRNFLVSIANKAHKNIVTLAKRNKEMKGMGTTIVLAWIVQEYLYVVWSGDSRCYYYNKNRDEKLDPFTEDHSLVWAWVKNGEISAEEARLSDESNLILQSLGDNNQKPNPGFLWTKLEENDRILICSDGLNSMLSDIGIQQILDFSDSTEGTCHSLIQAANNAGGNDNISAIIIDINSSESNYPQEIKKKVSEKHVFIKRVILVFLVLISLGIIFRQNIRGLYKDMTKKITGVGISISTQNTTDLNDELEKVSHSEDIGLNIFLTDSNSLKNDDSAKLNTQEEFENQKKTDKSDSTFIKSELTSALITIEAMKLRLAQFEPGGSSFKEEFYRLKSTKLDSIKYVLDDISHEIEGIAQVNINTVVKFYDYDSAKRIYLPINVSLGYLGEEIKIATESK